MAKNDIVELLMERGELTRAEAKDLIREAKSMMEECEYDPAECEDIMADTLELEMDYIFDVLWFE